MTESPKTPSRWQLPLAALLSLLGLLLALRLTFQHFAVVTTGTPSGCNFGGAWNCDLVSSGEYSELFGVPLSHLGALFYVFAGLLSLLGMLRESLRSRMHGLLLLLAGKGAVISLGLFALSTLVIHALCLYCVGLYVVSAALLLILLPGGRSALRELRSIQIAEALRSPAVVLLLIGGLSGALGSMLAIRHLLQSQRTAAQLAATLAAKHAQALPDKPGLPPLDIPSAPSQGPRGAPVTLVEVSDFECPYCQKASVLVEQLQALYPGQLRVVFRHFPLDEACNPLVKRKFHDHACAAARTAYCAGQQGKFFEMAHKLFGGAAEDDDHTPLARELGLDLAAFARCLLSPEAQSTIVGDISTASQHGVRGVPVMFLNGRQVKGAQPLETYRQIIDEELAKARK